MAVVAVWEDNAAISEMSGLEMTLRRQMALSLRIQHPGPIIDDSRNRARRNGQPTKMNFTT